MKEITNIVKSMLPIALGVATGMFLYEQVKKATDQA